jgi:hypothetical protein
MTPAAKEPVMTTDDRILGSCLCGTVRFSIRPPFPVFQYCHCSRCQKTTGSAHAANVFVPVSQFEWTAGEDEARHYEHAEAKYFGTGFCGRCGTRLPWITRNGKMAIVPAGALDDDPGQRPARNVHFASRSPWYLPCAELDTFDSTPPRAGA